MNILAQFKRLPISTKRLLSIGLILAFVVALPLFVWAVVTQRFNILPRAASGEQSSVINCSNVIADQFETSQLDTMRWTASDGNSISQQNGVLTIRGSANEQAQHFLSYDKWIDGNFQMDVLVQNFAAPGTGTNDYATAELRAYFDDEHYFTIRWYKSPGGVSQINLWSTYNGSTDQGSPVNIPGNSSVVLRLVRDGSEMHGYYNIGDGYQQVPDVPPGIFTGIVQPQLYSYKRGAQSTTVTYDNFIMGCAGQVSPYPRPTPPSGAHCGICGGIANIQCQTGLTCYRASRISTPDQTGICIDQRGPAYCPSPTCLPRPACLDSVPACAIPEPVGGYCPVTTPTPGPRLPGECQACGGFTGAVCQSGLICQQFGIGIPERAGICVRRDGTSNCTGTPPPTTCVRRPPTVALSPETKSGNPGDQITYTLSVTNTDSGRCTADSYKLSVSAMLSGWIAKLSNSLMQLTPGGKGTAQVAVTSPKSPKPSPGPYAVKVNVAGPGGASSATANYNILPPPATVRPFAINFKLQGVTNDNAVTSSQPATVVVKFLASEIGNALGFSTQPLPVYYVGDGVYKLVFGVQSTDLPSGNDYALTLKSEKSLATRFCQATGQTTHCSGAGTISVPANQNGATINLDFSGIPLTPGDLKPQDGIVTTLGANSDLAKLLLLVAKPHSSLTADDLATGDLNYDGYIDIRDLFLFRLTLQTRYDE